MRRTLLSLRWLLPVLLVASLAADATAGIFRHRPRKSGCNGSTCTTGGASFAAPASGCASGVCPLPKK